MDPVGGRKSPRILLFHIRISTGHERAAQALAGEIQAMHPGADVRLIEALQLSSGRATPLICRSYMAAIRHFPKLWELLYDRGSAAQAFTFSLMDYYLRTARARYLDLIADFKPDVMICTQAIPANILARLKQEEPQLEALRAPLYGVATDMTVHRYWASPQMAGYFVYGEQATRRLLELGVPNERICDSGIPIDTRLLKPLSSEERAEKISELRLEPDRLTVLLLGGSRGLGLTDDLYNTIETISDRLNLLVPSGLDSAVYGSIVEWASKSRHNVVPFGYTSDMRTLYHLADIVVTKPGGLSLAEVMAIGRPMVIQKSLPGQETRNLRFVRKHGVGLIALTSAELVASLTRLIRDPDARMELLARQAETARPHAAREIVRKILSASRAADPAASQLISSLPRH